MSEQILVTISDDQAGNRIDKVLSDALPDLSRSRLKALIKEGAITRVVDGTNQSIKNASVSVKPSEVYSLILPEAEDPEPQPEDIPLDIVYEDEHLIVVNKAVGMVVHPAAGSPNGTLVNALLHHCKGSLSGIGGVKRPGIVHRIDKDTSGLLVVAKTELAHRGLATQFEDHSIRRIYTALVRGSLNPANGRIEANIGRHPKDRKKQAVLDEGQGRHAVSHYKTRSHFISGDRVVASIITCQLETGRTHQIRVHMAHKLCPLIGDPVYGNPNRLPNGISNLARTALQSFKRQALHARDLGFLHPITREDLYFSSELPSDIQALLANLDKACKRYDAEGD